MQNRPVSPVYATSHNRSANPEKGGRCRSLRNSAHLHGRMVEPAGEHFAVIGQDLLRRAIDGERGAQPVADRSGAFTGPGAHALPGVVIDSGERWCRPVGIRPRCPSATTPSGRAFATRRRSLKLPKPAGQKGQSRGYRRGFAALDRADSCFTTRVEGIRSHRPQVIRRGS